MNKLVSRNPVLRFKLGRKIIKGLYGLKPHEILGGAVNGETVGYVNIPGKGYIAIDAKGNAYTYGELLRQKNKIKFERNSFRPIKLTNYDRLQIYLAATLPTDNRRITSWIRDHSNNIANYWAKQNVPEQITTNEVINLKGPEELLLTKDKGPTTEKTNININSETNATPASVTRNVSRSVNNSPFNFGGIQKNWRGTKGSLDANVLELLRKTGFTGNTALEAQQYLNDNFSSVGLFGNKISSDNAWGNQSLKGFDAFMKAWNELQVLQPKQQVSSTQANFTQTPEFLKGLRLLFIKEETPLQLTERAIVNNVNNLQFLRNGNYNKSLIRNLISLGGFDPYKYTGALRKALRLYLNGESDDTSLLDGTDLARFTLPFRKQGGLLVSKNPIIRFKKKFRLVAQ